MPDELSDVLGRVPSTLPAVSWHTPEEIRGIERRRRQRRVAVTASAVVLIIALGGAGAIKLMGPTAATPPGGSSTVEPTSTPMGCPSGLIAADTRPPERSAVKLNIYNGTGVAGLARTVADDFRSREFMVLSTGNAPNGNAYDGEVAVIQYGPKAVGAAWLMQAFFINQASLEFDINRPEDTVDIILGKRFQQLATTTEVNQALAALGLPTPPPGTCAAWR